MWKADMDAGWLPPVDAWQSRFVEADQPRVCLYLGAQAGEAEQATCVIDALLPALETVDAERGFFVDSNGFFNSVLVLYWPSLAEYDSYWAEGSAAASWWETAKKRALHYGIWRERFSVAPDRFETLFSQKCPRGIGAFSSNLGEPVLQHGYWGSMRDRIAASEHDPLDSLCLIRSGQDWSACDDEERSQYDRSVLPSLIEGMNFLRDNSDETGCQSCRFVTETKLDQTPLERSFGVAAFRSLAHLERWAHTHETHLNIFNSFMGMVGSRGGKTDLSLWHEVFVLDPANCSFEYVNCHAATGIGS